MKNELLWRSLVVALLPFLCAPLHSATTDGSKGRNTVDEEIWALEQAYFANLYKADYDGVLALVHERFLGWPAAVADPVDLDASTRFMKQLISKPTSCKVKVERAGIQVLGAVALTQYTLHVTCAAVDDTSKTQSSRITHTWVKEGTSWKLLGGMSYDKGERNPPRP